MAILEDKLYVCNLNIKNNRIKVEVCAIQLIEVLDDRVKCYLTL